MRWPERCAEALEPAALRQVAGTCGLDLRLDGQSMLRR